MTTTDTNAGDEPEYRTVFVRAGRNGWGEPHPGRCAS
jgi:hypothetical protein